MVAPPPVYLMPNLLNGLKSHYECEEASGDLLDAVGSNQYTVQGTPGSVAGKFGNARGPLSGVTTGFQRGWGFGDDFDIRGTTDCSLACWVSLDSKTTTQEIFAIYTTTINQQAVIFRYDSTPDTVIGLMADGAGGTLATGPGVGILAPATGVYFFCGFSYDAVANKFGVALNGAFREIDGNVGGFPHTAVSQARIGVTVTGVSGSGLLGDLDHLSWWNGLALSAADFGFLYNNGAGRELDQYVGGVPGLILLG